MSTTIERHKAHGSVWNAGDLIAGRTEDGGFSVYLCTRAREVGPRGGVKAPAETVAITASTWDEVNDAIEAEGFERSDLDPDELR